MLECVKLERDSHGPLFPVCKGIKLDKILIPIFFTAPQFSKIKALTTITDAFLSSTHQVPALVPSFYVNEIGRQFSPNSRSHLPCICTCWTGLDKNTHFDESGFTVISSLEALLMSIHSPTILEAYFIYSPPSFNLNHFLPGITLTLDPLPVLNPSEKNFCIFPATVLQLPAPGTLFFAFPPAKAGKPSLPRPLHVCTTSLPLLLLRAVNQAILSCPASSIFPSLPDHLIGIKTHSNTEKLFKPHPATAPMVCCLLQKTLQKSYLYQCLQFLFSNPWIIPVRVWLHHLARSTLEFTRNLSVIQPNSLVTCLYITWVFLWIVTPFS